MKRNIKNIYALLALASFLTLLFNGCEKDDSYNYNEVIPLLVGGITGSNEVIAHGNTDYPSAYSVINRGGSTYSWWVEGYGATITQDKEFPSKVSVAFNQSSVDTVAYLKVVEKTAGGKYSDTASIKVSLSAYCAPDFASIYGDYTETDPDGNVSDVTISSDPSDPLSGLIIKGVLADPEAWFGTSDASIAVTINGCNNTVSLAEQAIGIKYSTYGDVYVGPVDGAVGSYDPATGTIKITIEVFVATGSFGSYEMTYTKKAK